MGDTGRDQRIIKTIYGRGYRFVADNRTGGQTTAQSSWCGACSLASAVRAEGDHAAAGRLLAEAATLFDLAGQPLDAQRCLDAADPLTAQHLHRGQRKDTGTSTPILAAT